jgi:hypothetical protein
MNNHANNCDRTIRYPTLHLMLHVLLNTSHVNWLARQHPSRLRDACSNSAPSQPLFARHAKPSTVTGRGPRPLGDTGRPGRQGAPAALAGRRGCSRPSQAPASTALAASVPVAASRDHLPSQQEQEEHTRSAVEQGRRPITEPDKEMKGRTRKQTALRRVP